MTLTDFFEQNRAVALAFSGGTDSAYLLYAALAAGCDVGVYYVKAEFQPQFELDDAERLARQLGVKLRVLRQTVLTDDRVRRNDEKRCYYCKNRIFSAIAQAAAQDGYTVLMDGTNASDDAADRPGMRALAELSVRSPLRECGLTKEEIRRLSREAGLFTWDKPAYACLATRIETGTEITQADLDATEQAEAALMRMGFSDFRVRKVGGAAKIQVRETQLPTLLQRRQEIVEKLKPLYGSVTLDLEVRA
ncbi:MAG: ATP-dependent sacrificial sulfur transferase LarE [Clostridia bacterium]|nr:ATP-dependent sacrificial sulfur transferase LarE [Clostridia bacterium]